MKTGNFKVLFLLFIVATLFYSCSNTNETKSISFYHWKAKATYNETYKEALTIAESKKVYLHYFDLNLVDENDLQNDGIYPNYLLRQVDKAYHDFDIVPVVYITNQVFKDKIDIQGLAERTTKLINQISEKQFQKEISTIQIDCDWTQTTKNAYFEFLKLMNEEFEVSTTIRLHQIKFQKQTGIPPVKSGTLMLYNIGDLKSKKENSILENSIVQKYINTDTSYPLKLSLGLPLFSQTIVTNTSNKIKIIKDTERSILEHDSHFKKVDETNFSILKDTLYKGFYLSKGYNLKLEELSEKEIITSYKTVKNSKLNIDDVIFYHLDDNALNSLDLEKIITEL
ncbi:hypothetical protein QSV08_09880 [Maribacter sp. BPC-D8]|uniref:hypothetical protein n=1 Tax=Maribacter sp. BPC-D8 TaxID=3053613 RepID=UPI002B46D92A|nr:hypothetical protein [Maribacter sp. BPC-D8]WRI31545.1 hypothetical protein QSV08_09880 [Maribacter sp. BPC-D8]